MGKNKKTRWRTFSFDGTKDETNIADGSQSVLNDIDTKYNNSSETPHKYSQILGDHHTNFISSISNRNSSSIHNSKTRNGYNNKENYYNQRSAAKNTLLSSKVAFGSQRSQKFPNASNIKDNKKPDNENGSSESNAPTITSEPIKFNEDEYTRITTPRQDVLFKKGYLSRMNSSNNSATNNKTVSPATVASTTDSTAPNSNGTTTNSDQESNVSVSTLSPATTPSMDYGQIDGMEYATPLYYPGYYYDENGILVIPMYNGYNYYSNGSSATSPVYLMPYPYQYDPFFMAPNTEVPISTDKVSSDEQQQPESQEEQQQENNSVDSNADSSDKAESEKTNKSTAEEQQNGVRMSSEDATSNSSSNQREETESDEKEVKPEQAENSQNETSSKQPMPFYSNEFGYVYPTYSNGFYNGLYYYPNAMPSHRPSKLKRRKRFLSARNSHPSRSTETTTDYSDDDAGNSSYVYKRYNHSSRHHNGWIYHHNNHHYRYNYNQYHYNSKYNNNNRTNVDKNANETSSHSNLNVDVPEFYPCVQSPAVEEKKDAKEQQESKPDVPAKTNNDLQIQNNTNKNNNNTINVNAKINNNHNIPKVKSEMPMKINNNNINNSGSTINKASHTSKTSSGRVSKKEIIEGIKSMEQQNINLISASKIQMNSSINNNKSDDEWNVIKNGKKIKVHKDVEENITAVNEVKVETEIVKEEIKLITSVQLSQVNNKKSSNQQQRPLSQTTNKSKKSKGKNNKKKKNHMMGKQDGFEIIEPEFGQNNSDDNKVESKSEEEEEEFIEEEKDTAVAEIDYNANTNEEMLSNVDEIVTNVTNECEQLIVVNGDEAVQDEKEIEKEEKVQEVEEEEIVLKVLNNVQASRNNSVEKEDDAVIDISDEDICNRTSIEIDLSIAQEIVDEIEKEEEKKVINKKKRELTPLKIECTHQATTKDLKIANENGEDLSFFENHKNIAELERDLMENLKILDDGIDIKSPIINPLYDFPITSAVQKWLQEKQHESFENLFRLENFKKLSELYDDCENDEDDKSDISDSKSGDTTDSDYASDIQVNKINGSPASSNAKITSRCNNKVIVKESFCALM